MTNEALFVQYRDGNPEALGALYTQLQKFIRSIANELTADASLREELCSVGAEAFVRIIDGFDPDLGLRLTTYIYTPIRYSMLGWLNDHYGYINNADEFDEHCFEDEYADDAEAVVLSGIKQEILERSFNSLSARDRYILGHFYGAFGYARQSLDDIAFAESLRLDGAEKAKSAALSRLRESFFTEWRNWSSAINAIENFKKEF
ncbi:MAG: sigma-70 family RNA polymerase sigma factor [Oscillospiraceae bacterium]|nr:sigma-70 family RNA polymerase sigma factor [Oscillospiraceae bacterium]